MFENICLDGTLDSPNNQVVVIIDEMKIKEELVYHGHSGEFVGYVDLGDSDLNDLVDQNKIATNILGIYVKGISNANISYMVSYVPSDGFKATTLYHIVLKTLSLLVNISNLFPVAIIADGSQPNRTMFNMLSSSKTSDMQHSCPHPLDSTKSLYFVSDPSHLVKTARNNLLSSKGGKHKCLWNNGDMLWSMIADLYFSDVESVDKLSRLPKLTYKHICPSNFERMRVGLAAQVMSHSVGDELEKEGHLTLAEFVKLINKFFDICNSTIGTNHTDKKAFYSIQDERIEWLNQVFIPYFINWKKNVAERKKRDGGAFTNAERSKMMLSDATFNGLIMTAKSFTCILQHMLNLGADYVIFRRISQDVLESFFGRVRQKGGSNQNPNVSSFGNHMQMLNVTRSLRHNDSKCGNVSLLS